MAEKASGADKPKKTKKAAKDDGGAPAAGHNLADLKKKAVPALKEILGKFNGMESDMGTYRSEIKDLYEKHSNALGVPRKIMRMLVAEVRAAQRTEEALAEMEGDERAQLQALQASLVGTPFADYVTVKLAEADKTSVQD